MSSGVGTRRHSSAERAAETYRKLYRRAPDGVWSAPGRVNLIGEHTDYNDGFVLPFALPHRTAVAAGARTDGLLSVSTVGDDGRRQRAQPVPVAGLRPGDVRGWAAYVAGVCWSLREHGVEAVRGGADLVISGDVPAGAGLSSSAALECAVALTLLGLAGIEPRPDDDGGTRPDPATAPSLDQVARWAQAAENDFVGAPTGVLDQMASMCCRHAHALFLDVRSGARTQVPFDAARHGLAVLVIDTRVNHSHAESGYGERRRGCERAASLLGVPALRDVAADGLADALDRLPGELHGLVRHVVTENDRVGEVVRLLEAGRLRDIGPSLTASHISLRDDYLVSAPELDLAVDVALDAGALGARMTGGGFGGSMIALVAEDGVGAVERAVGAAFAERGYAAPRAFLARPSDGAGRDI